MVMDMSLLDELVDRGESRTARFQAESGSPVAQTASLGPSVSSTGTRPRPLKSSAVPKARARASAARPKAALDLSGSAVNVASPWMTLSAADVYVRAPRRGTVSDAVSDGELEAYRLPGAVDVLVHADDVDEWMRSHPYVPSGQAVRG